MKKWLFLIITGCILTIGLSLSNAVNLEKNNVMKKSNDEYLNLVLQVFGDDIQGKINSIIIPTENYLMFFDDTGRCIKKSKDRIERYMLSKNQQYVAVINRNKEKEMDFSLGLYSYSGELLWENRINDYFIDLIAVADDGKRVLASIIPETEEDIPGTIKYFGEKGEELASIKEIAIAQFDALNPCVSNNARYWVCLDNKMKFVDDSQIKWLFFDGDGKKLREIKVNDKQLLGMGDNGNYLISEKINKQFVLVLYNSKGEIERKFENEVSLSSDGRSTFYWTKDQFIFDDGKEKSYLSNKSVNRFTKNRVQQIGSFLMNKMSYDGSLAIIQLESNISDGSLACVKAGTNVQVELSLVVLSKMGIIIPLDIVLNDFKPQYSADYSVLSCRNIMQIVWDRGCYYYKFKQGEDM